jgi:autotransporter-associated beta strand protein
MITISRRVFPPLTRCGAAALCLLGGLCSTALAQTVTWSGGTNTVGADQTVQGTQITVTGGTNTVQGLAGPPTGTTSGGTLRVIAGGNGLQITGATVTLNSDNTSAGRLLIQGDVSTFPSSTTALIASGGSAAIPGTADLGSHTALFTVASGTVPSPGPDLSITARLTNGGLEKAGPGIIALSGDNTYSGGTKLDAGTFYINSPTAIGTGFFTVAGPNTAIDNKSGGAITLTNNNQFNLSGGDLNFIGSSDLSLGTGIMVMSNASRTINVASPTAFLVVGGRIQDAGQNLGLTKAGPGTLVLAGENLYTGGTALSNGSLILNGSTNSGLTTASNTTFLNNGAVGSDLSLSGTMSGTGAIHGSMVVNNGGVANFATGTVNVDGAVTNNGTLILRHGAVLTSGSGVVNNATLDLTTAGAVPANLTNNGTIIDASSVTTRSATKTGNSVTVKINGFTGHTYILQRSVTTPDGTSFTSNIGSPQQGSTGNELTFTDPNASGTKAFYRVVVDS